MNILKANIDTTNKKELYRLTKSESQRVQDMERGVSLPVDKYCLYEEEYTKKDGTTASRTVLAVTIKGGMKIATISATFITSFLEIVDIMEDEEFSIVITGGTSKGGRDFVNCELDCD